MGLKDPGRSDQGWSREGAEPAGGGRSPLRKPSSLCFFPSEGSRRVFDRGSQADFGAGRLPKSGFPSPCPIRVCRSCPRKTPDRVVVRTRSRVAGRAHFRFSPTFRHFWRTEKTGIRDLLSKSRQSPRRGQNANLCALHKIRGIGQPPTFETT